MNIEIENKTYEIKYGFKALIVYEGITNESFKPTGLNSIITLMYSCILAKNEDASFTFDQFLDKLDEQPEKVNEFSEYIVACLSRNSNAVPKKSEDKKKITGKARP